MSHLPQLTFQMDNKTQSAIEELKAFFDTSSNAAAVRSAIALARTIAGTSGGASEVIVRDSTGKDVKIVIAR